MIQFEQRAVIGARGPRRADIPLFVGAVARRGSALVDPIHPRARAADPLYRWLEAEGWTLEENRRDRAPLEALLDVPVPIESFAQFDRLFAWESRLLRDGRTTATYLGLAVRAFFQEGGRRCYIVRVSDPWFYGEPGLAAGSLIPNDAGRPMGSPLDRSTWLGIWHLYGLPDVSFVCLPDLPDASAPPPPPPEPLPAPPPSPEGFLECTESLTSEAATSFATKLRAPRCDSSGYRRWAASVRIALDGIQRAEATTTLREVQLIAAVPLPQPDVLSEADGALLAYLRSELELDVEPPWGLASPFLQLVYPWMRMRDSERLPEGLASPDGAWAGILASNALERGTFRSVTGWRLRSALAVEPTLAHGEISARGRLADGSTPLSVDESEQLAVTPRACGNMASGQSDSLAQRVSLLGSGIDGICVLSDVSTSVDPSYRQAHVRRLLGTVIRGAREIGLINVFEGSTPRLWDSLRDQMTRMLRGLWASGALSGANEWEAFRVRCDRSTMSQNDIDNGRVVLEVELAPAPTIERILVSFCMQDGNLSTRAA